MPASIRLRRAGIYSPAQKKAAYKMPKFEQKIKIKQPKNSSSEIPYQLAAVTWMAQLSQCFFFNLSYSLLAET